MLLSAGCNRIGGAASDPAKDKLSAAEASARGEEIAGKMLERYRGAKSYADHAIYVQQSALRGEGIKRELPFFQLSVALERPNKLRLKFEEAIDSASGVRKAYDIASDGQLMRATTAEVPGQVHQSAAPERLSTVNLIPDPLLREVFAGRVLSDTFPQVAMLLNEGDESTVFPHDEDPRLLGTDDLRGRQCFRVATTSPAGQRVLWIDSENYALHRMELPIEAERRSLDAEGMYTHLAIWIDFEDPTFDADIDENSFVMDVPAESRRVRQLVAPPPAAPPEQVGHQVAEFELTAVGGDSVTPATLAGKAVLLDFWQTNCAVCKAHTPAMEKVFREFKDSPNVAIFGVNIDGAETSGAAVDRTFRSWGRTMPVLRDATRESFKKLNIAATPTLMLLGADGRLQYLHTGVQENPDGLAALVRKVEAGADLAAEARAEYEQTVENFEKALAAATIDDQPAH